MLERLGGKNGCLDLKDSRSVTNFQIIVLGRARTHRWPDCLTECLTDVLGENPEGGMS